MGDAWPRGFDLFRCRRSACAECQVVPSGRSQVRVLCGIPQDFQLTVGQGPRPSYDMIIALKYQSAYIGSRHTFKDGGRFAASTTQRASFSINILAVPLNDFVPTTLISSCRRSIPGRRASAQLFFDVRPVEVSTNSKMPDPTQQNAFDPQLTHHVSSQSPNCLKMSPEAFEGGQFTVTPCPMIIPALRFEGPVGASVLRTRSSVAESYFPSSTVWV